MNNYLIVGNSHVGALKQGFDCIETSKSANIVYVALPGSRFKRLTVSNRFLDYPEEDAEDIGNWFGIDRCPCLDDFDKILYVHGPCRLSLQLYSSDRRIPCLSLPVVREIFNDIRLPLFNSLLETVGPSKLIYLGSPLISTAARQAKHLYRVPLLNQDNVTEYCLADCIREVCRRTADDDSMPSVLLPPQHLLAKHQFNTLDSYIRGGFRINGESREDGHDTDFNEDMGHGNAEYGKEMATHVIDCLAT